PRVAHLGRPRPLRGRRIVALLAGLGGAAPGAAAGLSRPGVGRQSPGGHRTSDWPLAPLPRGSATRPGAGVLRSPVRPGYRCDPVRRRLYAGAFVAGRGAGEAAGAGLPARGPQLLHDRLLVRDRTSGCLLRDSPTRFGAPLPTAGYTGARRYG